MGGKFEIYKDQGRVPVPAQGRRNGDVVAQGEAYPTKAHAKRGIQAVQRAAVDATVEDLTKG